MRNITAAIFFSKLIQRKVKNTVVLTYHVHPQEVLLAQFSLYVHKGGLKPDSFHFTYHVLLICIKSMFHYELIYPVTNMLSHTLIEIARVVLACWRLSDGWLADGWLAASWRLACVWLAGFKNIL